MRIKVTVEMAKHLKRIMPQYKIQYVKLTRSQYGVLVDYDLDRNVNDYLESIDRFKAIRVVYPADNYGRDLYISTSDLMKCYRESDKTLEGFNEKVIEMCEI